MKTSKVAVTADPPQEALEKIGHWVHDPDTGHDVSVINDEGAIAWRLCQCSTPPDHTPAVGEPCGAEFFDDWICDLPAKHLGHHGGISCERWAKMFLSEPEPEPLPEIGCLNCGGDMLPPKENPDVE